jgi:endonuclease/exonuclease/phosphatase family metal-dependent hydrolase
MRIATWNLRRPLPRQARRRERLGEYLRATDADVSILTETHADVSPGPGFRVVATADEDRAAEPGERWTTIWSRHPLRAVPTRADPARAVAALIDLPGGRPLVVYGSVLPWIGSPWRGFAAAEGAAFAAALEAQCEDWMRLRAEMPDCDLCVAGDLNQDLAERHFYGSKRNREALAAALQRAGLVCLTAGEHDPVYRRTLGWHATVDHICVSGPVARRARATAAWPEIDNPDLTLSDHFGVVVELADS